MVNVDALKVRLIDELWMPKIKEVVPSIYPRRKKHIELRLFTLSDGINFGEILKLETEKLITRTGAALWIASDFHKRMRVESENVGTILEGDFFADAICDASSQLCTVFPRDIINLDFSTQQTVSPQRIKSEIICLEKNVNLQNQKGAKDFLLLFTSILDASPVEVTQIVQDSNAIQLNGWSGLTLPAFPQTITDKIQLQDLLKALALQMCQKYGFQGATVTLSIDIPNCQEKLFSMAIIVKRAP